MNTTHDDVLGGHLRSTLGFEMHVHDVMTKEVISIPKFESIMRAANILSEKNISGLPVVDKGQQVIGIITQADILTMLGVGRDHTFKDLVKIYSWRAASRTQDWGPCRRHYDCSGINHKTRREHC